MLEQGTFFDPFLKDITDGGQLNVGLVHFSRPYSFSLSGTYSSTSQNVFSHSFDQSIYPQGTQAVTGYGLFCTAKNSFSGYYQTTIMQLYNQRALDSYDGSFSTTTVTSSVSSSLMNFGRFNASFASGDSSSFQVFTASVTSLYIFCFDKRTVGDRILDGTASAYVGSSLLGWDASGNDHRSLYTLTSSSLSLIDSASSLTRLWVMPDNGKFVFWSSSASIMNSFSGVTLIGFSNSVGVTNYTFDLRIGADEFNNSDNFSFYDSDYSLGRLPTPWITGVGIYSPWNELLAVCKFQKPIKKTDLPITVRVMFDRM